jgi:hypothetical protein
MDSIMDIEQIRTQHAVGQGSFHSASIRMHASDGVGVRFDYVYDCGALVGSCQTRELTWALKHYQARPSGGCGGDQRPVIDALVLSHFDRDHMNGADDLAKSHRIRRVYLPYLSPEELIVQLLHDMNVSGAIYPEYAHQLFELAHGGTAWGAPLTRVGIGEEPRGAQQEGPFPPNQPEERPYEGDNLTDSPRVTYPAQVWELGSGVPIGDHLDHTHTIGVGRKLGGPPFWTVRFWNYRNGDHAASEVWLALQAIGCPVDQVRAGGSIGTLLQWLALKAQRSNAIKAYHDALNRVASRGHHVPMKGFANLMSLALLSAPAKAVHLISSSDSSVATRACCHFLDGLLNERSRGAWLGTGDAPLGEPAVWDNFCNHYGDALASVQTVVVPHHGAAPANGHAFYNPGLNARPGINAVISVGERNNYGHPHPEVLRQILSKGGRLQIVSEGAWPGYVEWAMYSA